jgi:hypothetical protein
VGVIDVVGEISSRLVGRSLVRTERGEYDWVFRFTDKTFLRVACPWRILHDRRIALGECDHAQKFGRPEPIDGANESDRLFCDKTIQSIAIREDTADLTVEFSDQTKLEILNTSSGYEGWELGGRTGLYVVAMGGGQLALWTD